MPNTGFAPSNYIQLSFDDLRRRLRLIRAEWRKAQGCREAYSRTFAELHKLSDRDLADIGIPRSHIKRVAHEAGYGEIADENA